MDETVAYARQARARLWNAMLGGSDVYENDRGLLTQLNTIVPDFDLLARNERDVVSRFWRYATGIRNIAQVVYLGAPLPVGHPPHRSLAEPGRVVYVEGDELLYRKGSVWLGENGVDVVQADPLDVAAVIDAIDGRIDWLEPVAVIAPSVLPWADEGRARTWVNDMVAELAPGSLVATTHFLDPELEEAVAPIEQLLFKLDSVVGAGWFRRRAAIGQLFAEHQLETPGVVKAVDWFPNGPRLLHGRSLVDELLAVAVAVAPSSP
ncbi:SAM-dependent methyltransferase [Amycolatopsis sp. NPDC004378]